MRILKENSIGLIIDIQEKLLPHIYENDLILNNTITLVKGLQLIGVPIITTQQYSKGLGQTVSQIIESFTEFQHIEKMSFSCYDEPEFENQINNCNKSFVIIAGIETHVCVLQTAIDLLAHNFIPVVVENCVSSRKLKDRDTAIERLRQEGTIITSFESVLFELCRYAGTDVFKTISKLVK